ncbi:MAG TPA: hypothetical protein ENK22_10645 [Persephonella sp.]|nr:hypothetical protein [Persephonella sp.]
MFTKSLKTFLVAVSILSFSYGIEIKNSDVRIEILSRIKTYEKKIEKLKEMYKVSSEEDEKVLIKKHIRLLRKKIEDLERVLRDYEKVSPPVG